MRASPCTWTQILALFPNLGIHKVYGAVVLKAGSGWAAFRGNVDAISIGVSGVTTTFNFEESSPRVTLLPPDSIPTALFQSLGSVTGSPPANNPYRKDIVIIAFNRRTPLALRQAAIDSIGGRVVGGRLDTDKTDGFYYVQISGGTNAALVSAVLILQRLPQVSFAGRWELFVLPIEAFRRPTDGLGWTNWQIGPLNVNSTRDNWALEYVNAPMAWGCSVGSKRTTVAVVDRGPRPIANVAANFDAVHSNVFTDSATYDHGTRVASIVASVGNDSAEMTGMAWNANLILRDRFTEP